MVACCDRGGNSGRYNNTGRASTIRNYTCPYR